MVMKMKIAILIATLLVPLWFCILFSSLPIGSIGPMVPLTWIVNSVALPIILIYVFKEIRNVKVRKAWMVGAWPLGLVAAYFQFLSYMSLTAWFRINDFYWL